MKTFVDRRCGCVSLNCSFEWSSELLWQMKAVLHMHAYAYAYATQWVVSMWETVLYVIFFLICQGIEKCILVVWSVASLTTM